MSGSLVSMTQLVQILTMMPACRSGALSDEREVRSLDPEVGIAGIEQPPDRRANGREPFRRSVLCQLIELNADDVDRQTIVDDRLDDRVLRSLDVHLQQRNGRVPVLGEHLSE